jgi:PAS domain S-box-containing protein
LQLRKLSHAVEQSPVSIVITDLLGGIEYVNPKFCALTGYSFEEVRGKNPRILKSGSMPNESYRQMWATITSGEEWHGEFHNRKKNGELYWELASISPIRDDKGNVTHFVAMKEDITERKRMEVSLRESEERYRALFDRSLDCVYVNDFEGRFLAGNPAAFALLGYGREELASLSFSSFLMPEHLSRAFRMAEQLRTGGTQTTPIEYTLRRKDGSFVEIETNASLIMRDGQPHSILGIARDITERKRVEDGLKEQLAMRERLAKIAANVPGIIYSFRLRPDGSACIPYASPTIEAFCEVRAEDLVEDATPLFKIIHPDDHGRVWESIMESARTMSPWRVEFRVRHPQRGLLWIEGQSTPERSADGSILWHGFMSEISERKQAEKTLREKEHLLSESQRLGHIGSWFADLTGPLSWSEEMYRIFGVSPDAFIPTAESLLGLIHPDNQPAMQAWLAGCAVGAKPVEMEFCITRPDGMIRFIKGNSEAVYDVNHRLIHIAGTAQDITESKQAQVEREGLERMVAEHQANEESVRQALLHEQKSSQIKSRFVSMVSHEFRTPLSVINLAVELLKGYWERMTPAERSEQLKEIQGAIARMTQMMTDFLVQGDCTSGTMECQPARVAVEELCRRLIAEVPSYANSPRTIELVVAPPIGEAFLDENILRHILGNLLSNAVKYSSAGQPVKLEVQRIVGTTQSNGGTDAFPEPYLEFKVSDSGIGIPATDLPKLYQAFHRATNVGNRPGTGIGLTIVKQFVDLHRGTIRFESQEGKGTTVWVHLPIAPPASRTES